jgi:hypothetical protein
MDTICQVPIKGCCAIRVMLLKSRMIERTDFVFI